MKSHASNLLELATCVYNDAVAKCTDVHLDVRDLLTLKSRVEHEGLSFLTITLPSLGADFERSLRLGQIEPTLFRSFRKSGKAPAFLQGFFAHVFDETGRILHEPSIPAIEGVRQIAYTFKKLEVPCHPDRVAKALTKFKQSEHSFEEPLCQEHLDNFDAICRVVWPSILRSEIDLLRSTKPKHGPGATAERLSGNAKFLMRSWHERLEPYFPILDNVFASATAYQSREFEQVNLVPEEQELPVRVIPVPKTLKGPRIIAIEPVCMQYTQQALSQYLVKALETHPLTKGHLNFRDQSVNRRLAISSSRDERYATLDLSSASDLVPYEVAIRMFSSNPDLMDAISACRSKRAQMPNGDVLPLAKFASMGSALCFPVEAMYFYTLCVMALLEGHNLPVTYRNVQLVSRDVYVYGDDIIVPTDMSDIVTSTLQKYYCKVNVHKSFSTGNFRESCGMDAFAGEEVTPTYVRQLPPGNKRSTNALISWTASSNLFYKRGYWQTASFLMKRVEAILGVLPVVGERCAGLGKISFQPRISVDRWNKRHQVAEVSTWVGSPVYQKDLLNGYPALLKCLLLLEDQDDNFVISPLDSSITPLGVKDRREGVVSPRDVKHLQRSARHGAVALRRRWVQPY